MTTQSYRTYGIYGHWLFHVQKALNIKDEGYTIRNFHGPYVQNVIMLANIN